VFVVVCVELRSEEGKHNIDCKCCIENVAPDFPAKVVLKIEADSNRHNRGDIDDQKRDSEIPPLLDRVIVADDAACCLLSVLLRLGRD